MFTKAGRNHRNLYIYIIIYNKPEICAKLVYTRKLHGEHVPHGDASGAVTATRLTVENKLLIKRLRVNIVDQNACSKYF